MTMDSTYIRTLAEYRPLLASLQSQQIFQPEPWPEEYEFCECCYTMPIAKTHTSVFLSAARLNQHTDYTPVTLQWPYLSLTAFLSLGLAIVQESLYRLSIKQDGLMKFDRIDDVTIGQVRSPGRNLNVDR